METIFIMETIKKRFILKIWLEISDRGFPYISSFEMKHVWQLKEVIFNTSPNIMRFYKVVNVRQLAMRLG
jgi:hypothetical protein